MELRNLNNLIMTPNFDGILNLERFVLKGSPKLEEINASIGRLEKLASLRIEKCPGLKMFPSITRLKKLDNLSFKGSPGLFQLSEIQQKMENLPHLHVECCVVRGCVGLVELLELPSSIVVRKANYCSSLETFGDISNCKWLWNISLYGVDKVGPLDGYILLDSMLKVHAIDDQHISVILHHQIPKGFVDRLFRGNTYTLRLPCDWYNDFCGFLIHVDTYNILPVISIVIKQEIDEDSGFELWQESNDQELEREYDRKKRHMWDMFPLIH